MITSTLANLFQTFQTIRKRQTLKVSKKENSHQRDSKTLKTEVDGWSGGNNKSYKLEIGIDDSGTDTAESHLEQSSRDRYFILST